MENVVNTVESTAAVETKEVLKLNLKQHVPFKPVGDVSITTTTELAKVINEILSQVFKDYYGCNLQVQYKPMGNQGGVYVVVPVLFFHVLKPEEYNDGTFAFLPIGANPESDLVGRVQRIAQMSSAGAKVTMTEDGKSILEDFVINPNKNQEFDWNQAYSVQAAGDETFIQVFKLDILKFITKIFGDKDEEGSVQYYQITPIGVLNERNMFKAPSNWSLNIMRLNHNNEAAAAELLGLFVPNTVAPNVITERLAVK